MMRTQKMKAYLDSVSQHKIDETQSEMNSSFVSIDRQRKDSAFAQKKGNELEDVDEVDDESRASVQD